MQVCGLKWSPDNQYLASGGNDNRLLVWSQNVASHEGPVLAYDDHLAAVKAIAWSPHQHGLLASGGGTADRCIRFRNTLSGQAPRSVETESQGSPTLSLPLLPLYPTLRRPRQKGYYRRIT